MNYTIYLKKSSYETLESIDTYSFISENNEHDFMLGVHATYRYYKTKTPKIEIIEEGVEQKKVDPSQEKTLYITTVSSQLEATTKNLLFSKGGKVLYLPYRETAYDIEHTWNIIQKERDLSSYKEIVLHITSWSKMVYAYRAATSYALAIKDTTY